MTCSVDVLWFAAPTPVAAILIPPNHSLNDGSPAEEPRMASQTYIKQ